MPKAGHVTGGSVFGYDNVRVNGHVERRINEEQAAVIRRIFALCAAGTGYTRIAKQLNAEGAVAPRSRRDRPTTFVARPESDWVRIEQPDLRIVSAAAWDAAYRRLDGIRTHLEQASGGRSGRRQRDIESRYLLSGFARCAVCGGSVGVLDRRQYGCIAYHKRGTTVCRNAVKLPVATLDEAVLTKLRVDVLRPAAVLALIDGVLKELAPTTLARDLTRHKREFATLDREIAHLAEAIAQGGHLTPLLDALKTRQDRRATVMTAIEMQKAIDVTRVDRATVTKTVRASVEAWRTTLSGPAGTRPSNVTGTAGRPAAVDARGSGVSL